MNEIKNAKIINKNGKPYRKEVQLNDDYKVIFRRDFDEFSHGEVLGNHWNLEIQTTAGNTKYDLHVFFDEMGNILPIIDGYIFIPSKSPFH